MCIDHATSVVFSSQNAICGIDPDAAHRDMPGWILTTLFANAEPSQTFAVLDAASVTNLTTMLDASDEDCICLFQGKAQEDLGEVAPWLVRLDCDRQFTRNVLSQSPAAWHLFDHTTLLFFRTTASMNDLRAALRKLTKVTRADGKAFYLRFWEGLTLFNLLEKDETGEICKAFRHGDVIMSPQHLVDQTNLIIGEFQLTVSDSQLAGLDAHQSQVFIEELFGHLREKDPFHAAAIGDPALRDYAKLVVERAHTRQFTQKSTVKLFGQMMMYLGTYFDSDPALPWVATALNAPLDSVTTQTNRANLLRDGLLQHLEHVCGAKGEHRQAFLAHCRNAIDAPPSPYTNQDMIAFITRTYPKAQESFPDGVMQHYIQIARDVSKRAQLTQDTSTVTLLCLMIVYGHGVSADPLFPWLHKFLNQAPQMENPDKVLQRLTKKFLTEIQTYIASKSSKRV